MEGSNTVQSCSWVSHKADQSKVADIQVSQCWSLGIWGRTLGAGICTVLFEVHTCEKHILVPSTGPAPIGNKSWQTRYMKCNVALPVSHRCINTHTHSHTVFLNPSLWNMSPSSWHENERQCIDLPRPALFQQLEVLSVKWISHTSGEACLWSREIKKPERGSINTLAYSTYEDTRYTHTNIKHIRQTWFKVAKVRFWNSVCLHREKISTYKNHLSEKGY